MKKGFDIRNLSSGGVLAIQTRATEKKLRKRRTVCPNSKNRISFLHEAFSQKELLSAALLNENLNVFSWKSTDRRQDVGVEVEKKKESVESRVIMKLEGGRNVTRWEFRGGEVGMKSYHLEKRVRGGKKSKAEVKRIERLGRDVEELIGSFARRDRKGS